MPLIRRLARQHRSARCVRGRAKPDHYICLALRIVEPRSSSTLDACSSERVLTQLPLSCKTFEMTCGRRPSRTTCLHRACPGHTCLITGNNPWSGHEGHQP